MTAITLRPVDLDRDFAHMAYLFSIDQDEPEDEPALRVDYDQHKERIFCLDAAEDEKGNFMGFNWATRDRDQPAEAYFYVIVRREYRCQGAGTQLYAAVEKAARGIGIKKMEIAIRDDCPECLQFAAHRGFSEHRHSIGMTLNLAKWDDVPFQAVIDRLSDLGFRFTTMEELGNTEDAQRKLFWLNDTTSAETPGSEGVHPWNSFEDFQKRVCGSDWYDPSGQFVVIDTSTGAWAAMSAITRFKGADYAYNLFTGVDRAYRGRKLGQAVKTLALRFAREHLGVNMVKTHHNANNAPMIAIDNKFGYQQTLGKYHMVKILDE